MSTGIFVSFIELQCSATGGQAWESVKRERKTTGQFSGSADIFGEVLTPVRAS